MATSRRTTVLGALAGGALLATLAAPTMAWAHVGLSASSSAAGSSTLLTFGFSHGCEGSPTTRVAIKIPAGINAVSPTVNNGWTVRKVMAKLDAPITDAHGNQLTERVDQVVYTAKQPLADGLRDALVLSLTLPEDAAGTTLAFPTVQTCVSGNNEWVEVPAPGQNHDELQAPAPTLTVTAAQPADDHESGAAQPSADHNDSATAQPSANHHESGTAPSPAPSSGAAATQTSTDRPLIITSIVVGVLGLLTGGWALLRSRRSA